MREVYFSEIITVYQGNLLLSGCKVTYYYMRFDFQKQQVVTETTKIRYSIQLLAPWPYLKVLTQFIHQNTDLRKRFHVNKPLA